MKLFLNINPSIIIESSMPSTPTIHLDEIDNIENSIDDNLGKEVHVPKDVLDSFALKSELNPEIWVNDTLNPKVRTKLTKIATDFYNEISLSNKPKIKDIIFTGSLANFNWSKYSDIDLHIVLDFSEFDGQPDMVKDYFDTQKILWNQEHDISVFKYPVEIYIQDVNAKLVATAVYSILRDKWLLKPKREQFKLDKNAVKTKALAFINKLRGIRNSYSNKDYQAVIDKTTSLKARIKKMRHAGLEDGGEYSLENIVFKTLRRTPFLDVLDSYKAKAYDNLMSVDETLNENLEINQDDIRDTFYSGQGMFELKNVKPFAKKYLGYDLIKQVGYGGNGAAYLTSKGTKLKFTFNENEYEYAKRCIGRNSEYRADYYSAKEILNGLYVIEMEFLQELSQETKLKLKQLFRALLDNRTDYDKKLKAKIDKIKSKLGAYANDLTNDDNYGLKNGQLATFDPVAENLNEDSDNLKNGIILIKGRSLEDGTHRLYAAYVKYTNTYDRKKKDGTEGLSVDMVSLNPKHNIYRLVMDGFQLKAIQIAFSSPQNKEANLEMKSNNLGINDNKTPLHWETLKFTDMNKAINQVGPQILKLPNIKWVG